MGIGIEKRICFFISGEEGVLGDISCFVNKEWKGTHPGVDGTMIQRNQWSNRNKVL